MNQHDSSDRQNILLIEDDEGLANLIAEYLESAEFSVGIEHAGHSAVERIVEERPDLVVVDLMLPGKDGISICREVRPNFENPILMLTASNESVDHIVGLEVGADDFIQKPVEPRVLLAHIRALLRRSSQTSSGPGSESGAGESTIRVGNIEIDDSNRQVKLGGNSLALANPEYEILLLLATNRGRILSRDEIFQSIRGIDYDGVNRLVDITISQIRSKLGEDGNSHRHIKTVRNKGYLCVESID